jgi:hypothetical protein
MNNSDAIPMTISKDAYRGSARNIMPIQARGTMTMHEMVKFMGGNNPIQTKNGPYPSFVPATDFFIPINKDEIRKNKVVPASVSDEQIVDKINLKLAGGSIYKDDVALFDIVATNAANGWKRPIYFAVTVRPEKIGIFKNYLQLEGMALRIVPIMTQTNDVNAGALSMGRVEVDAMYQNLMEKFRWGGFDKYKMFVDESYSPSIQTQQYAFVRLVNELRQKGDKERAVKALEKMYEAFPNMNFPIDDSYAKRISLSIFIELDAAAKAKPHVLNLAEVSAEKLKYFSKFIGTDDLYAFLVKFNNYSSSIDAKRRELSMIIQKTGSQDMMNKTVSDYIANIQTQLQKEEAERDLLIKSCKNPKLVEIFENEIMTAVSTAQQALDLASEIGDEAFKKQIEGIFAPYKIKSKQQTAPKMKPEAPKDSTVKDTAKK